MECSKMCSLHLNHSILGNSRILLSTHIQLQKHSIRPWLNNKNFMCSNNQLHRIRHRTSATIQSSVANMDASTVQTIQVVDRIEEYISYIKNRMSTIDDGRISVAPYDTAWMAMIKNIDGRDLPQFPSSLTWIVDHQLPDGSWGDEHFFSIYDRLLNTIACVIALKSWNLHAYKIEKGICFMKNNVWKLEDASDAHMLCGFELIFPALLRKAQDLGILDIPIPTKILTTREDKLKKIPIEVMHQVTSTLLYSMEALVDLDWERILKLQSPDGSFFTSPSATAFAFMQTQHPNCFKYISNIVQKFHGGAPTTYPVDFYSRLFSIDRLKRLGISRFFESEIEDFLAYVYRFWKENGIYSARDLNYADLDDTSMAFRLLRLQGYNVNQSVIGKFKEGDKFHCHIGEVNTSVTPIYNLHRASQIRFPGEDILEQAYNFSYNFVQDWLRGDELLDKWIVSENLPHEIKIGVGMPWYASLPRVEAAYYIKHYGGSSDVWIAKTLYRMPDISNEENLELAKLDFKRCQTQHQIEWSYMEGWHENMNFQELGISRKDLLVAYFLAAATIFEPERAKERIAWVKSQIIIGMIRNFLTQQPNFSIQQKNEMLKQLTNNVVDGTHKLKSENRVLSIMQEAIYDLFEEFAEGISDQLRNIWGSWLMKFNREDETWQDAGHIISTINIVSAHFSHNDDTLFHEEYVTLSNLVNRICHHLSQIPTKKVVETINNGRSSNIMEMEADLQALTKLVLDKSSILNKNIKQTFLLVTKTFYYSAHFDTETIDLHIFKVLFDFIE